LLKTRQDEDIRGADRGYRAIASLMNIVNLIPPEKLLASDFDENVKIKYKYRNR
jgi:hypothetical protein